MASDALIKAVAVTVELTGTSLSAAAKEALVVELSQYPEAPILRALDRCRRELKGRLTIPEIIDRIEGGHPGADEAWALIPKDESGSVFWTAPMAEAYGVALPLMDDTIQARMAFKEAYTDRVRLAQSRGEILPKWMPSFGFDAPGRGQAIREAVERGRLTRERGMALLEQHCPDQAEEHQRALTGPEPIAGFLPSASKEDAA